MLQPRLRGPLRALDSAFSPSILATHPQSRSLSQFFRPRTRTSVSSLPQKPHLPLLFPNCNFQIRHASHASQGVANNGKKNSPGKRLGAKKTGDQYVVTGNIIFRQRGTKWFPGENCGMGRDHTIFALQAGYVKYYRDPERHPDRKYIGVTFDKEDKLPYSRQAATKRRLGMVIAPRRADEPAIEVLGTGTKADQKAAMAGKPSLRPGYMYCEANWEIGRVADKAGVKAAEWKRKDRWAAWRKKTKKIRRNAQLREAKGRKKAKAKAKK